jgi:phage shock protein C
MEVNRMENKKLFLSSTDKKFMGVCGGIGEYFNVDPTVIRVLFVIGAFMSAGTLLAVYGVLCFVMPSR